MPYTNAEPAPYRRTQSSPRNPFSCSLQPSPTHLHTHLCMNTNLARVRTPRRNPTPIPTNSARILVSITIRSTNPSTSTHLFSKQIPIRWGSVKATPPTPHPPQSTTKKLLMDLKTTPIYPRASQNSTLRTFPRASYIRTGEAYGDLSGNICGPCRGYLPSGWKKRGYIVL